jgi:hypothetical protein
LCKAHAALEEDLYPPLFSPFWEHPDPAPGDCGVTLTWGAQVHPDGLEVTYTVKNSSEKHFEVLNRLYPEWNEERRAAHIGFNGTGLMLSKQTLPKPETTHYVEYVYAQPSPLAPGGTVSETFRVELPAVVNYWTLWHWLSKIRREARFTPTRSRRTDRVTLTIAIREVGSSSGEMTLSSTIVLPTTIEVLDYEDQPQSSLR